MRTDPRNGAFKCEYTLAEWQDDIRSKVRIALANFFVAAFRRRATGVHVDLGTLSPGGMNQ